MQKLEKVPEICFNYQVVCPIDYNSLVTISILRPYFNWFAPSKASQNSAWLCTRIEVDLVKFNSAHQFF